MMKKISSVIEYSAYGLIAAFYLFGCQKNETVKTTPLKPEVELSDRNTLPIVHLYSDTVYILKSSFVRNAGQELVVDEGTLIKAVPGNFGSGGDVGVQVNAGGIIRLNGSRNKPVVFTTSNFTGTQGNNWTGISITGKAKNNDRGPAGDTADFSGTLTFVRIEFAPLTLDAVGDKTIIENVMVSYTGKQAQLPAESSFKIFGGNFNAKNLVSYACGGGADFYITNGYAGKLLNLLAYRNPLFGSADNTPSNTLAGLFISNNQYGNTTALPYTSPAISNLTVLGPAALDGTPGAYHPADPAIRSAALVADFNSRFMIRNSLLLGFPTGGFYVNDGLTAANIESGISLISTTFFHANDSAKTFYLNETALPPFNSYTLAAVMLQPSLKNRKYITTKDYIGNFGFTAPYNFNKPGLLPEAGSPVLTGADFSGPVFSNSFFTAVPINNIGAVGQDDWLSGWANFTPLKTNYNLPDYKPF